jgi:hypothetical protein
MPPLPTGFTGWGLFGVVIAILLTVVYALITGKLIPKATVDAIIKHKDNQVDDMEKLATLWESTAMKKDQALEQLMPAMGEILEVSKTQLKLIESLGTKPAGEPL